MKPQKVIIVAINDCKNGNKELKRVELLVEMAKSASQNKVAFLCGGSTNIDPAIEKRRAWENISAENVEKWGLKPGDDLGSKIGVDCALRVVETLAPQYEGHKEKVNPKSGVILKKGGSPIFRNTVLEFDLSKEDELIAHDVEKVTSAAPEMAAAVKKEEFSSSETA